MIRMILFVLCLLNMSMSSHWVYGGTLEDLPMQKLIPGSSLAAGVVLGTVHSANFTGVNGTVGLYMPKVKNDQSSGAIIWARNGSNFIGFGWHVAPQIYNDYKSHLYAVWTKDNFNTTGCYNRLCPGFVQTDKTMTIGGPLDYFHILDFELSILQDLKTGNWLVCMDGRIIGYFPASLFSNMSSATQVGWGGTTTTSKGTPSPPMGTGLRPPSMHETCSFRTPLYREGKVYQYPKQDETQSFTDQRGCYAAIFYGDSRLLEFGGPGGNCED